MQKNDFLDLHFEYNTHKKHVKAVDQTMEAFLNYYNDVYQAYLNCYNTINSSFSKLDSTLVNLSNTYTYINAYSYSKRFLNFHNIFKEHLTKVKTMISNMKTNLILPTKLIISQINNKNNSYLQSFKSLIKSVFKQKNKYEFSKHFYLLANFDLRDKMNEEPKDEQTISKHKLEVNEENERYKTEFINTNKHYDIYQEQYVSLFKNFRSNEKERLDFIIVQYEIFLKLLTSLKDSFIAVTSDLQKGLSLFDIKQDMNTFDEKFNLINNDTERIIKEEYLNFDVYYDFVNSKINKKYNIMCDNDLRKYKKVSFEKTNDILDKSEQNIINNIFNNIPLMKKNKESRMLFCKFREKINKNENVALKILNDYVCVYKNLNYYSFNHTQKMMLFVYLLKHISQYKKIFQQPCSLFLNIMDIAEKTFCKYSTTGKCYISDILAYLYGYYFQNKKLWLRLLYFKIHTELDKKTKVYIKENKNENNLIANSNQSEHILFSQEEYNKYYKKAKQNELFKIVESFIPHFANFNVEINICREVLQKISNEYKFNSSQIACLIALIIRNANKTKNNIFITKRKTQKNKALTQYQFIFYSVITYFPENEWSVLFYLNKISYNRLFSSKVVIKNFKIRYKLWLLLLQYNMNNNKFNYNKCLTEAQKVKTNSSQIIELDVSRTHFLEKGNNTILYRKYLLNNLQMLNYIHRNNFNYYQGMNFISSMLIEISGDEEIAFHIFNALITNSQYYNIFKDNFALMNKYFFIFDKLLMMYFPEVYKEFIKNNISANCYLSSWFITLFTNIYNSLPEGQEGRCLMYILDRFICEGWLGIIKVALAVMKYYEEKILEMKNEILFQFMVNKTKMIDVFKDENFEIFKHIYEQMCLNKNFINDIENEYDLYKKI